VDGLIRWIASTISATTSLNNMIQRVSTMDPVGWTATVAISDTVATARQT
jgi:hypothetical protein